ncbi:extracellular solute-binding protein [Brachybacterium phenoliresistens]|uniref:extracellular solute-binding protein n=1 Tax=Brachybacterium phenoliresistens TaxID=396014 RepID=UPI0031D9B779
MATTRRSFLTGAFGAGALALGATGCSAISGEGGAAAPVGSDGSGSAPAQLPTTLEAAPPEVEAFHLAENPGMSDVYTQGPTSFAPSVDRAPGDGSLTISVFQFIWGTPPVDREKNPYWQELEQRLGVTYDPQFVPAATYDAKFSTMLASGDIPDLVFVNDQSAVHLQAIREGAFADLSETLGGDGISRWPNLAARSQDVWRSSLKDGRIFQLPSIVWPITNLAVMRRDVLESTSIGPEPQDADQLMKALIEAKGTTHEGQQVYGFTKIDRPMFTSLFRVGAEWQRDASGDLVHMSQTANYREMLTWLAAAWKDGVFDPNALTPAADSTTWRSAVAWEAVSNAFAGPLFADTARDHPGAQLDYLPLPGFDGTAPLFIRNVPYGRSTSISAAAAQDEERLTAILDVMDYLSAPWGSEEFQFVRHGIEGRHWELGEGGQVLGIEEHAAELGVQYVAVDSGSNPYRGHPSAAGLAERFSAVMESNAANSQPRLLEGYESASATFVTKGAQLKQSLEDFENGVITGRESVDDLDAFVQSYLGAGGEQVRSEYEAVLKAEGL